jgi:nucleoside-diphosphate-sugar epimerase
MKTSDKVVVAGGAGLVGQNLILMLREKGYENVVSLDKHAANNRILRQCNPSIRVVECDLAETGSWINELKDARCIVFLQAQIGGLNKDEFVRNNLTSTAILLAEAERAQIPYLVHVSSSVVNSAAYDFYKETKDAQERLVDRDPIRHCVLRPTLMFGWFDRKHLGWLSRFMKRVPIFPIPGSGRYIRQPLFVLDFCKIIIACMEQERTGSYNISGLERVYYIDIIRQIRDALRLRTRIVKIPYRIFDLLLRAYALFDRNPPFTTQQLAALVIPEEFEMIDWPSIFGVKQTPWIEALRRTFQEMPYCEVVLEF